MIRSSSTSSSHAASSGSAARGDGEPPESVRRSQRMPVSEGMPERRASQGSMAPRSQFPGGNAGSGTQSLRQPTSGGPSGRPGGGTSAPVLNTDDDFENWDWETEIQPLHSSHQSSGPQSAADPGPAASAGSSRSPGLWRSSISPQQRYSQAETLDAHESAVRDRDDAYHTDFSEAGTLLNDVLGYYSRAYEMDEVVVHRLAPSKAGSGS